MSNTDKELFREYLASMEPDNSTDSLGTLYLTGFNYDGIDIALRDMANSIIIGDPLPLEELDFALQEFRGVVLNLERLKAGFLAFRSARVGEVA